MKVKVYNLIILDESGSMQSIRKPAVDGLNETLQSIQSAQETHSELQEHFITIIFFNSNGIRTIIENEPINQAKILRMEDFCPNACTPLYDAMGISLSKLRYILDEKEQTQVLVTIITDGYENASKEYSGKMVKNLVRDLKSLGWVFAYIGANQNVHAVADSMSIDNRLSFNANTKDTITMSQKLDRSREEFYYQISESLAGNEVDLQKNFFRAEEDPTSIEKNKDSIWAKTKKFWKS